MTSKIKAVSLALFAIAAMSMIAASAAQAGLGELHVTNTANKADITGDQLVQHVFKLGGSGLETRCTQAKFEGTIADAVVDGQTTASEGTITGTYTGCQSQGPFKASVTVKMNGCKYTITGGTTALTANVDIAGCTSGKKIELETEGCRITIGEQGPLSHMTFTNTGSGETQDVDVNITISGIQYQLDNAPFCILGTGQFSDATYNGTATFKGFVDQGTTTLKTHEEHQYNELICGAQRGLFAT